MKVRALFPASMAVLTMLGCAQQRPPSPQGTLTGQYLGAGSGPSVVGGSAQNTTSAFDGTYRGLSSRGVSAAGTGLKAFEPSTTGCQQFETPPALTITNGLGQFQALGVTFAGYVTPQGHLRMVSGYGPTVDVDYDPQTRILRGQANSVNCR